MNINKVILIGIMAMAASAMALDCEVTEVTARQRYPWNGLVDISCTAGGVEAGKNKATVTATDLAAGTNVTVATLSVAGVAVTNGAFSLGAGANQILWDAQRDLPKDYLSERMKIDVAVIPYSFSVKFNANGGTGTMANESFDYGTAKALTANAFTRSGYTFSGWATTASGAVAYTDKQSVSNLSATDKATVNLYAVWKGGSYTMKFNANGGSGSMATQTFEIGKGQALAANEFTKSKYSFFGWSTSTSAVRAYSDKEVVTDLTKMVNGTVNLYAIWTIPKLATGINCTTLPWVTDSTYPWSYHTAESRDGVASVMSSGARGGVADSWLQTTIKGPATIKFYYAKKHYSSTFTVKQDSTVIFTDSTGTGDAVSSWIYKTFSIPSGVHTIRFNYHHSGTGYASGGNGIRIDQFSVAY